MADSVFRAIGSPAGAARIDDDDHLVRNMLGPATRTAGSGKVPMPGASSRYPVPFDGPASGGRARLNKDHAVARHYR